MVSVQAGIFCGFSSRGIAGLEGLAQTDVRQDAADYNRYPGKIRCYRQNVTSLLSLYGCLSVEIPIPELTDMFVSVSESQGALAINTVTTGATFPLAPSSELRPETKQRATRTAVGSPEGRDAETHWRLTDSLIRGPPSEKPP